MSKLVVLILSFFVTLVSAQNDEDYIIYKFKDHSDKVNAVSIDPTGEFIATAGEDQMIYIYNLKTGEEINKIENYYYPVKALKFVGDNRILYSSGDALKLITTDGEKLFTYPTTNTHITMFAVSPSAKYIAAGSYDKKMKVWNFVTGDEVFELDGHTKSAMAVGFSADNKYIATGASDNLVRIWSQANGEMLNEIHGHSDILLEIEFMPEGHYFASAGRDNIIRLWDASQGRIIKTYVGHDKGIVDIEFTPDGQFMISASYDRTINVWETTTGENIYSFYTQEEPITDISLSPDARYMVSGSEDETAILWKFAPYLMVDFKYPNEVEAFKSSKAIFDDKRRGEDKDAYETRLIEANEVLLEKYLELYNKYIQELKLTPLLPK